MTKVVQRHYTRWYKGATKVAQRYYKGGTTGTTHVVHVYYEGGAKVLLRRYHKRYLQR